jgi:uncharacterized iron-regulated protein
MKFKIVILALFILLAGMTKDKPAYQIFNVKGKKSTYKSLLKDANACDVILFGEEHNNPISHWLELQLAKDLYKAEKQNLILGAEMFESDNQTAINKYLKGDIKESDFKKDARFWKNYDTDYKPLMELARNTNMAFIATNSPRKYASLVYKGGFDTLNSLTAEEKQFFAPLPFEYDAELGCYKKMLQMDTLSNHTSPNLPKAQAIKDATMAYFIMKNLSAGKKFLHFNGSYHSDYFEGIMWYLKKANPYLTVLTIATVEQSDISKLSDEYILLADYIIVVPDDMTKTYEDKE